MTPTFMWEKASCSIRPVRPIPVQTAKLFRTLHQLGGHLFFSLLSGFGCSVTSGRGVLQMQQWLKIQPFLFLGP
jgi:hypothetical protein